MGGPPLHELRSQGGQEWPPLTCHDFGFPSDLMAPLGLLMLGLAAPAGADGPLTAEAAMERYRATIVPVSELVCPKAESPDEIVVCGRTEERDPNRLPIPGPPVPGRIVPGEAMSAVDAMGQRETCSTGWRNRDCGCGGGSFPVLVCGG